MTEENKLEGLGGWLIIVGLVSIFAPMNIVAQIFSVYSEVFSSGTWEALTAPGSDTYNPLLASYIIGEIAINVGVVLAWLVAVFLFFSKKKLFPKWLIGIFIFSLLLRFVDALAIKVVLPGEPIFDPETTKEFVGALIGTLICASYMLKSKRVKATFIK